MCPTVCHVLMIYLGKVAVIVFDVNFSQNKPAHVKYIHLYGLKKMVNKFFYLGHPHSLLMFKRNCEVPFRLLIYLQRVCFSPPSQVSLLLQQNEVSKYISVSCTRSHFFLLALLCIVISIYNSLHLALLQMSVFFFSDFCSSNICFLSVASGEQKLLFIV